MKLNYSEPKIFTGGVDISCWSKLSLPQKKKALDKDWFVYFSFRNPSTGKLKKQPFIKAGVNKLKTKRERYAFLRTMQKALLQLLEYGFNPYEDNSKLEEAIFSDKTITKNNTVKIEQQVSSTDLQQDFKFEDHNVVNPIEKETKSSNTIADAIKLTLELKAWIQCLVLKYGYRLKLNLR